MRAYERLIEYTKYATGADSNSETCPSTPEQLVFGKALVKEMEILGIKDASMDENGYVFGTIESNIENWKGTTIGFIAHMDVVQDVPFDHIKPRIVRDYDGSDIILNEEKNLVLRPREFTFMTEYIGQDLVVTDGTTLLGSDDKAGIAEILTMVEYLNDHPEVKHGTIKIGFTPDEEIGRGADRFDVERFGADYAYTVDGGAFGEVEYETFNAAEATIHIQGNNIHPGSAKNKMKNAMQIGMEFHNLLPEVERPEHTEQYEGFYHLTLFEGIVENAKMHYILRDHDLSKLTERKAMIEEAAAFLNRRYGKGTVQIEMDDNYYNMAEKIKPHWHLIETAYEAVKDVGGEPYSAPVRGGTDGSRLSFMGLPCPNLGTGSHNPHGKMEFSCIQSMDKCVQMLVKIAEKYGTR